MKRILLSLIFVSGIVFGTSAPNAPFTYRLNTETTNLTATFPANPQIGVTVPGPTNKIAFIDILNNSSSEIEVNCSESTRPTSISGSANVDSVPVPGTTGYSSPQGAITLYPFGKVCWLRSVTGTISSGVVEIIAWGY